MRYVRQHDGVFVGLWLVMAGLDPAIHDFKGRLKKAALIILQAPAHSQLLLACAQPIANYLVS